MAEEEGDGVGLPQKGLNMMIKDALPDMRIANETRELLNQCCVEFIKHVSREAQLISSKDQRKTIYHDHVQKALKNLGFPREYVDAANSVLGECKMAAEKRLKRKNSRLDKCGIPEEQLWQMQQRLIEQARRNEVEKQQQEHQSAFGQLMGCELQQQQMQQQSGGQQPFMAPPAGPVAGEDGMADGPTSSSSSAFASSFSSMLPPMMMPFGLTPEQLIVPSTTFATGATPAIGTTSPALDPMLEATAQLLFMPGSSSSAPQHPASGSSANALLQQTSSSGTAQEGEDEEEEEDEEEDYDV